VSALFIAATKPGQDPRPFPYKLTRELEHPIPLIGLVDAWPGRTSRGKGFPSGQATVNAAHLFRMLPADADLVLVGTKVAEAFGVQGAYLRWRTVQQDGLTRRVAVFPLPGSVRDWWADPKHATAAARFLRAVDRDA
jgi:hypothetical protein